MSNAKAACAQSTVVLSLAGTLLFCSGARAEDDVSMLLVRDQGKFGLYATVERASARNDEINRFPSPFAGGESGYDATLAFLGINYGVGHGAELFASIPYSLHSSSEFTFDGDTTRLDRTGFEDASIGLKYQVVSATADGAQILLRAWAVHHSANDNSVIAEATAAHGFAGGSVGALTAGLSRGQGSADTAYTRMTLNVTVSPVLILSPTLGYTRFSAFDSYSPYNQLAGGAGLQYTLSKNLYLFPSATFLRRSKTTTSFYANDHGVATESLISASIRREF